MGTPTQYLCDYGSRWVRLPKFVCGLALILVLQLVGPLGPVWGCDILVIRAKVIENQIMAASAIAISSDSSDESVGSPPSRVILFGDIPTIIPSTSVIAPETSAIAPVVSSDAHVVEKTIVASPTGLCGLDSDPSEASDSSEAPPSQDPYVITVARWRSRVTTRSSSPSEFPTAPVIASPGTRRPPTTLVRPMEDVPFGRPYRTRPNGPRRLLTARKRVGPLPVRRLARRCVSPRSSSSLIFFYSIFRFSTSAFFRGDSLERPRHSSSLSVGPSRKRCRSSADSVPSSTPVTGSLAPTRADLLPPRKRFSDSYSPETNMEEDTEIDTIETENGRELAIIDGDDVRNQVKVDPRYDREEFEVSTGDTVVLRIDLRSVPRVDDEIVEPVGGDSFSSSSTRDGTVRSVEDMPIDLDHAIRDFYHHMSEVHVDRIVGIETTQRQLKADQMIASGERASMAESIRSLRSENLKVRALLCIERDRVDSLRLYMSCSQAEFRQIRDDRSPKCYGKPLRTCSPNCYGKSLPANCSQSLPNCCLYFLSAIRCNEQRT
uniref:Uncharacterized protein n=1 Tax=Tanacetum cinerariifolium TaxID=118510 RepID=A0A699HS85_TANCI|nr:hypothetical protein [Tanacetum cinerariifolium]